MPALPLPLASLLLVPALPLPLASLLLVPALPPWLRCRCRRCSDHASPETLRTRSLLSTGLLRSLQVHQEEAHPVSAACTARPRLCTRHHLSAALRPLRPRVVSAALWAAEPSRARHEPITFCTALLHFRKPCRSPASRTFCAAPPAAAPPTNPTHTSCAVPYPPCRRPCVPPCRLLAPGHPCININQPLLPPSDFRLHRPPAAPLQPRSLFRLPTRRKPVPEATSTLYVIMLPRPPLPPPLAPSHAAALCPALLMLPSPPTWPPPAFPCCTLRRTHECPVFGAPRRATALQFHSLPAAAALQRHLSAIRSSPRPVPIKVQFFSCFCRTLSHPSSALPCQICESQNKRKQAGRVTCGCFALPLPPQDGSTQLWQRRASQTCGALPTTQHPPTAPPIGNPTDTQPSSHPQVPTLLGAPSGGCTSELPSHLKMGAFARRRSMRVYKGQGGCWHMGGEGGGTAAATVGWSGGGSGGGGEKVGLCRRPARRAAAWTPKRGSSAAIANIVRVQVFEVRRAAEGLVRTSLRTAGPACRACRPFPIWPPPAPASSFASCSCASTAAKYSAISPRLSPPEEGVHAGLHVRRTPPTTGDAKPPFLWLLSFRTSLPSPQLPVPKLQAALTAAGLRQTLERLRDAWIVAG